MTSSDDGDTGLGGGSSPSGRFELLDLLVDLCRDEPDERKRSSDDAVGSPFSNLDASTYLLREEGVGDLGNGDAGMDDDDDDEAWAATPLPLPPLDARNSRLLVSRINSFELPPVADDPLDRGLTPPVLLPPPLLVLRGALPPNNVATDATLHRVGDFGGGGGASDAFVDDSCDMTPPPRSVLLLVSRDETVQSRTTAEYYYYYQDLCRPLFNQSGQQMRNVRVDGCR